MRLKDIVDSITKKWRFGSRKVAKATILYWYILIGGGLGLLYSLVSLIIGTPMIYALAPVFLLVVYLILLFVVKNWSLLWLYLRDIDQGRLLLRLNDRTHFQYTNKIRVVKWVYPRRNQVRNETWLRLGNKIKEGIALTKQERKQYKKSIVGCPQQLIDGINQAILVDSLIYAHRNIRTLDPELREIMKLTDDNIMAFDLQKEVNKCKVKSERDKINKLTKIGMERAKQIREARK